MHLDELFLFALEEVAIEGLRGISPKKLKKLLSKRAALDDDVFAFIVRALTHHPQISFFLRIEGDAENLVPEPGLGRGTLVDPREPIASSAVLDILASGKDDDMRIVASDSMRQRVLQIRDIAADLPDLQYRLIEAVARGREKGTSSKDLNAIAGSSKETFRLMLRFESGGHTVKRRRSVKGTAMNIFFHRRYLPEQDEAERFTVIPQEASTADAPVSNSESDDGGNTNVVTFSTAKRRIYEMFLESPNRILTDRHIYTTLGMPRRRWAPLRDLLVQNELVRLLRVTNETGHVRAACEMLDTEEWETSGANDDDDSLEIQETGLHLQVEQPYMEQIYNILSCAEEGCSIRELGELIGMEHKAVTKMVDLMEKDRYCKIIKVATQNHRNTEYRFRIDRGEGFDPASVPNAIGPASLLSTPTLNTPRTVPATTPGSAKKPRAARMLRTKAENEDDAMEVTSTTATTPLNGPGGDERMGEEVQIAGGESVRILMVAPIGALRTRPDGAKFAVNHTKRLDNVKLMNAAGRSRTITNTGILRRQQLLEYLGRVRCAPLNEIKHDCFDTLNDNIDYNTLKRLCGQLINEGQLIINDVYIHYRGNANKRSRPKRRLVSLISLSDCTPEEAQRLTDERHNQSKTSRSEEESDGEESETENEEEVDTEELVEEDDQDKRPVKRRNVKLFRDHLLANKVEGYEKIRMTRLRLLHQHLLEFEKAEDGTFTHQQALNKMTLQRFIQIIGIRKDCFPPLDDTFSFDTVFQDFASLEGFKNSVRSNNSLRQYANCAQLLTRIGLILPSEKFTSGSFADMRSKEYRMADSISLGGETFDLTNGNHIHFWKQLERVAMEYIVDESPGDPPIPDVPELWRFQSWYGFVGDESAPLQEAFTSSRRRMKAYLAAVQAEDQNPDRFPTLMGQDADSDGGGEGLRRHIWNERENLVLLACWIVYHEEFPAMDSMDFRLAKAFLLSVPVSSLRMHFKSLFNLSHSTRKVSERIRNLFDQPDVPDAQHVRLLKRADHPSTASMFAKLRELLLLSDRELEEYVYLNLRLPSTAAPAPDIQPVILTGLHLPATVDQILTQYNITGQDGRQIDGRTGRVPVSELKIELPDAEDEGTEESREDLDGQVTAIAARIMIILLKSDELFQLYERSVESMEHPEAEKQVLSTTIAACKAIADRLVSKNTPDRLIRAAIKSWKQLGYLIKSRAFESVGPYRLSARFTESISGLPLHDGILEEAKSLASLLDDLVTHSPDAPVGVTVPSTLTRRSNVRIPVLENPQVNFNISTEAVDKTQKPISVNVMEVLRGFAEATNVKMISSAPAGGGFVLQALSSTAASLSKLSISDASVSKEDKTVEDITGEDVETEATTTTGDKATARPKHGGIISQLLAEGFAEDERAGVRGGVLLPPLNVWLQPTKPHPTPVATAADPLRPLQQIVAAEPPSDKDLSDLSREARQDYETVAATGSVGAELVASAAELLQAGLVILTPVFGNAPRRLVARQHAALYCVPYEEDHYAETAAVVDPDDSQRTGGKGTGSKRKAADESTGASKRLEAVAKLSVLRPWINPNGTMNDKFLRAIRSRILLNIYDRPGMSKAAIIELCRLVPVADVEDLLFDLVSSGHLCRKQQQKRAVSLFSSTTTVEDIFYVSSFGEHLALVV